MSSTSPARRAARIGARALYRTANTKVCIGAVAVLCAVVSLLLMFGMIAVAYQTAATADVSEIGHQDIPAVALLAYQQAAADNGCDALHWSVLAGIGKVESNHGRYGGAELLPNGDTSPIILGPMLDGSGTGGNRTPLPIGPWRGRWGLSGDYQQALGPMQFLPDTFARFASTPAADPHNINDAARAAAAYLCDGGISDIGQAIRRYNNSQSYVDEVLHWAALYQRTGGIPSADANTLARNPHVHLTEAARGDLEAGIVDPRLVQLLAGLAVDYELDILSFRTGHPRCKVLPGGLNTGPNCAISNHWEGRAVDIMATAPAGQPLQAVSSRNASARAITEELALMPMDDPLRPDEVGSPWAAYEDHHGHFSNSLHQDHLHLGFQSDRLRRLK